MSGLVAFYVSPARKRPIDKLRAVLSGVEGRQKGDCLSGSEFVAFYAEELLGLT